MFSLRRTMAAGYTLAEAVSLEDVQAQGEALLRPVESMFTAYPLYTLPSPGKEAGSATATPLRCRSWRTVPIGSMAKTENFSVFPVPKAAR